MDILITDPVISRRMIRQRRLRGLDQKDEVWEGVYVMAPPPNDEHQDLAGMIFLPLQVSIRFAGLGLVRQGVGISDRPKSWTKNFRVPDISVFLNGTTAIHKGSHWLSGPDFAVKIISPHDKSREKFDFYAKIGIKELLFVDRKPWILELYRPQDSVLVLVGKSVLKNPTILTSQVIPFSFQLESGDLRPKVSITHSDGVQRWSV